MLSKLKWTIYKLVILKHVLESNMQDFCNLQCQCIVHCIVLENGEQNKTKSITLCSGKLKVKVAQKEE